MATDRRDRLDHLTPERRAQVEAMTAKWHAPEATDAEARDRDAMAEEYRETGTLAGAEVSSEDLIAFREFLGSLRRHREGLGLSLAEVATRAGMDQPALSRLETGKGNPTLSTIARYARALGVRVDWRIGDPVIEVPGRPVT